MLTDYQPVELQNFRANIQNDNVMLNWSTATEINNYGFDIQRWSVLSSSDCEEDENGLRIENEDWKSIGFVKGAGNSNSTKIYSFNDVSANLSGKYYYRLKQVDTDGSFEYSEEIMIELDKTGSYQLEQNFPNPFNPTTIITYQIPRKSRVVLKIFDVLGRDIRTLVNEVKDAGRHKVEFNASDLSSGRYFYQINAGNYTSVKKLIVAK